MSRDIILSSLNQSQKAAVTCTPHGQLSILAGPGSGKTHTLAARIAWLLSRGTSPWNVIVTTFTVKTAREMRERIGKLIGVSEASKLILGTFHSIAKRYLTQYGHLINIQNNFGIADSTDSLAIIKRTVKRHDLNIDPKLARSRISGIKARGGSSTQSVDKVTPASIETQDFEICYREYESALRQSNLLDYDDLLLKCVDLLQEHPECVSNVEAVLIDEFQDTNIVQFDLMRLFAVYRKQITIVGDPDQSIYSFRAAEIQNYKRMHHHFPELTTISLEENYRSSGAILLTALNVIQQDSGRVAKTLLPTHSLGTQPVLRHLSDAHKESEWITTEIKRAVGMTGGLLNLNDFSILLRSAAISRLIEGSLANAGLAYKMVGGVGFYDRIEVRTILDYLRVIIQPENDNALSNILNVPSRKIGDITIKKLMEEAFKSNTTLWSLLLGIVQGTRPSKIKLTKQVNDSLAIVCDLILTAKNKILKFDSSLSLLDLLKYILQKIKFEEWLEVHFNDIHKARWSNVEELMNQVMEFQDLIANGHNDDSLPLLDGVQQKGKTNILENFLANVALCSETKSNEGEDRKPHITISTIHAAKGLEWPVVFIPAAYQGTIPHSRAEDSNEERRLLYVAMTRAKVLLYISRPMINTRGEKTQLTEFLSQFMSSKSLNPLINLKGPPLESSAVHSISQILHRPTPTVESISNSSSLLPSEFDDLFPVNVKYAYKNGESYLDIEDEIIFLNMSQNCSKRRCVRSIEQENNSLEVKLCPSSLKSGFVSAGSHLKNLNAKFISPFTGNNKQKNRVSQKKEYLSMSKHKSEGYKVESQQKINGYFGAPGQLEMTENIFLKNSNSTTEYGEKSDSLLPGNELRLENDQTHRIFGGSSLKTIPKSRPQQIDEIEDRIHHDYVFFSSSSRKNSSNTQPSQILENPFPELSVNSHSNQKNNMPTIESRKINPVGKKTLGVKRSMKGGWSAKKEFVPPTLIKPSPPNEII